MIVAALVFGIYAARGWRWHTNSYGFLRLRILNDTPHAVRVQPCWDVACNDIVGLHEDLIPAGASTRVSGKWVNNGPAAIVVGVLTLRAEPMHFHGCIIGFSRPEAKVAVLHVSSEGVCPYAAAGAPS